MSRKAELCHVVRLYKLTELYPGANYSNRDIVDLLQVVLHIIFCHSVQEKEKGGVRS